MKRSIWCIGGICIGAILVQLLWKELIRESSFFSLYTLFEARQRAVEESNFWKILFCNRLAMLVLWRFLGLLIPLSISNRAFPFFLGSICGSFGMCLWKRFAWKGIPLFMVLTFPQALFYGLTCIVFYNKILPFSKRGVPIKTYFICIALLGVGSLSEAYCNPYLLQAFLQYL